LNPPTAFVNFLEKPLNCRKVGRRLSGYQCHYSFFKALPKPRLPPRLPPVTS
jgi:hypothetical protein